MTRASAHFIVRRVPGGAATSVLFDLAARVRVWIGLDARPYEPTAYLARPIRGAM